MAMYSKFSLYAHNALFEYTPKLPAYSQHKGMNDGRQLFTPFDPDLNEAKFPMKLG